ncbi:hypothetical protein AB1L30_13495 [Bremerella sp. JC817]|uniref:hypothetical protein n=1 Tax=Bremerella sp. JC817 TaxID=3231756 RepID=UPI003457616B
MLKITLIVLAVLTVAMFAGMTLWTANYIGAKNQLDSTFTVEGCREAIKRMTDDEKTAHLQMTLYADTLFPLLYGSFLCGLLVLFKAPWGFYLVPAFTVVADYVENFCQWKALKNGDGYLLLKVVMTDLKFAGLAIASAVLLALFGRWWFCTTGR